MPVIALKDNPPTRYPNKSILASASHWWIAKVKPRQEKAFAFDLIESNIEYYLPLFTKIVIRKDTGKTRKSLLPLFPSYVPFVYKETPYDLLKNKRLSTILTVTLQERFKKELQQIYLAYEQNITIEPNTTNNCNIGATVEIISGSMKGFMGKIIKNRGNNSLLITVHGLGEVIIAIDKHSIVMKRKHS